LFAAKSAVTVQ